MRQRSTSALRTVAETPLYPPRRPDRSSVFSMVTGSPSRPELGAPRSRTRAPEAKTRTLTAYTRNSCLQLVFFDLDARALSRMHPERLLDDHDESACTT